MKLAKWITLFAVLGAAATTDAQEAPTSTEEKLAVLRDQFEELGGDVYSDRRKFNARYAEEVKKLKEEATSSGNLDLAIAARDESQNFFLRKKITKPSPFPPLARLQSIWTSEISEIEERQKKKLAGLVAGYRKRLEDLRDGLTKAGELDEAVKVQGTIDALASEDWGQLAKLGEIAATKAQMDTPIPGYDFGKPGKLRGFGRMNPGTRELGVETVAEYDDIIQIAQGEGGWQVLRDTGEMVGLAGDRTDSVTTLGRGPLPWAAMIKKGGGVFIAVKGVNVDPRSYGGGEIKSVATCWNRASLLLKEDGTLAVIGVSPTIANELRTTLAEVRDVVAVDASGFHLFALCRDGRLHGWRTEQTTPSSVQRYLNYRGFPVGITAIDGHSSGVCALGTNGQVYWLITSGEDTKIARPKGEILTNIRKIWAGGDCGAALDGDGKLHAWAPDHGGIGLIKKIEGLKGIKDLAIMDRSFKKGTAFCTYVMWIE